MWRIPAGRSPAGRCVVEWRRRCSNPTSSSWTAGRAASTVWESGVELWRWETAWCCSESSAQLVPRQAGRLPAAFARELPGLRPERLAVPAAGADRIGEREDAAHPLDLTRLAPHDAPALGGMVADLEEAAVDRHVTPGHVQHHDVTRVDADHGIPGAAAPQVGARPGDPGPTPRPPARPRGRGGRNRRPGKKHRAAA